MDNDVRDALLTLNASLAIIARRQTEQGELLALIVKLLTPDRDEEQGLSLQKLTGGILTTLHAAAATQAATLHDLMVVMHRLPADVAGAVESRFGHLYKAKP